MSTLSELIPSGGTQNNVEFVADGAIAISKPVSLQSNGKIAETKTTTIPTSAGTQRTLSVTADQQTINSRAALIYNTAAGKYVYIYEDGNNRYLRCAIATISGDTMTLGNYFIIRSSNCQNISALYEPNSQRMMVSFTLGSQNAYVVAGSLSGTTFSWGTITNVYSQAKYPQMALNTLWNRVGVVFSEDNTYGSGQNTLRVRIYTINSNNTFTINNTSGLLNGGTTVLVSGHSIGADSGNSASFLVTFSTANPGTYAYPMRQVVTIAGGLGTAVQSAAYQCFRTFASGNTAGGSVVFGHQRDSNKSFYYTGCTISGTTMTVGGFTPVGVGFDVNMISANYSESTGTTVLMVPSSSSTAVGFINMTVSGTSAGGSVTSIATGLNPGSSKNGGATINPVLNQAVAIFYDSSAVQQNPEYSVCTLQNSTNNLAGFIGITTEAISDTATGPVSVYGGLNTTFSGNVIGSVLYVGTNGLTFTSTAPNKKVGKFVSATTVNLVDPT